jgi:hypothetical protein
VSTLLPIGWRQLVIAGCGAGIAWAFVSIPLLVLLGGDLVYAVPRPLVTWNRVAGFGLNLIAGVWALWIYAAISPRYGRGLRSAALAGCSWWLIATITTWQWSDIGFLRLQDLRWLIVGSLPVLTLITIGGAWSYEKAVEQARPCGSDSQG